jgi:hypothetical protein
MTVLKKPSPLTLWLKVPGVGFLIALMGSISVSPALATEHTGPIKDVVITGNVISWTGAAQHPIVERNGGRFADPPNNIVFLCKPNTAEADCGFGGEVPNPNLVLAFGPNDGSSSLTISPNWLDLSGGNVFSVRVVFVSGIGATPITVPGGLVGNALPSITITATTPAPQTSSPAAAPVESGAPAPAVGMALQAAVGSTVEGTPVSFTGVAMKAGSTYVLQVNSEPIILATGTIANGGRISGLPRLPALPPGTHTLRLTTTGSDGSSLTIAQVFVVGDDGRFVSISDPAGSVEHATSTSRDRLAYTGVQSSWLPWWAMSTLLMGLLLVVYSARARHLVTRPDLTQALGEARTPWEILATPISVPGIDYAPRSSEPGGSAVTLGASIRELDLAVSKLIAQQIERFGFAPTPS